MVIETGIDMVEISRIKKSTESIRFVKRVYGKHELEYFEKKKMPVQSMAASFCAKEAFGKALGTGISGFKLSEVEVLHDKKGKPYLELSGNAKKIARNKNLSFSLSLTHTKNYATAVVIAYAS